jgi:hypothetical protein
VIDLQFQGTDQSEASTQRECALNQRAVSAVHHTHSARQIFAQYVEHARCDEIT